MAEIIDTSDSQRSQNTKFRTIGCIELSGDMNNMLRSEAIINIKQKLEQRDWVVINDFDQGNDEHIFVFELPRDGMMIFPEKPSSDWEEATQGYKTIYLENDNEMNPN